MSDELQAQRSERASDPDEVIRTAVHELAAELHTRRGLVSSCWIATRLEHLAQFGCAGPRGKTCVHNGSGWSPQVPRSRR